METSNIKPHPNQYSLSRFLRNSLLIGSTLGVLGGGSGEALQGTLTLIVIGIFAALIVAAVCLTPFVAMIAILRRLGILDSLSRDWRQT